MRIFWICRVLIAVLGLSHGYSGSTLPENNRDRLAETYVEQNHHSSGALDDINRPVLYPQLGMTPEYANTVYKYITHFAGNEHPPHVNVEEFGNRGDEPAEGIGDKSGEDQIATTDGTEEPETEDIGYFLPSDFVLLSDSPVNQFFERFGTIEIRAKNSNRYGKTNPPLGGVLSDYVLLRHRPDYQNYVQPFGESSAAEKEQQPRKRQITDSDDTVIIEAENQHSIKMNAENEETNDQEMKEGSQDEDQPAIAQSKPAAIALAGPGGVAQASPVGTALVGPGGLAVAAPSGTAVAGPAGQGIISPTDDKTKIAKKKIEETWN